MGLSEFYTGRDEAAAIATVYSALDLGVRFLEAANRSSRAESQLIHVEVHERTMMMKETPGGASGAVGRALKGLQSRPQAPECVQDEYPSLSRAGLRRGASQRNRNPELLETWLQPA